MAVVNTEQLFKGKVLEVKRLCRDKLKKDVKKLKNKENFVKLLPEKNKDIQGQFITFYCIITPLALTYLSFRACEICLCLSNWV